MRYLGIDYGEKRIGIALSDEEGVLAFPYAVIQNKGDVGIMRVIQKIIRDEDIGRIIVGVPRSFSGDDTGQTKTILRFLKKLRSRVLSSVEEEDEILTTRLVNAEGMKKKHADAAAAAVILQSYLDKISGSAGKRAEN